MAHLLYPILLEYPDQPLHAEEPLPDGRGSEIGSSLCRFFDDADLVVGQVVELVDQSVDLLVRRVDLPLDRCLVVDRLRYCELVL